MPAADRGSASISRMRVRSGRSSTAASATSALYADKVKWSRKIILSEGRPGRAFVSSHLSANLTPEDESTPRPSLIIYREQGGPEWAFDVSVFCAAHVDPANRRSSSRQGHDEKGKQAM